MVGVDSAATVVCGSSVRDWVLPVGSVRDWVLPLGNARVLVAVTVTETVLVRCVGAVAMPRQTRRTFRYISVPSCKT